MNAAATLVSMAALLLSVPVFMVFGLGSAGVAIWGMNLPWSTLIQVSFGAMTKHVLIAVPLFIFTGLMMLRGGAAERLVRLATALVGHWPGGLGLAMILAMGFFAAFCGSILAAITAVGTIMIPQMVRQGYPKPFVIVLAASAAFLEALIPPSNAAILFSALTDVPVSRTFAAGVLPGFALMGLLSAVVAWKCRGFRSAQRAGLEERLTALRAAISGADDPGDHPRRDLRRAAVALRIRRSRRGLGDPDRRARAPRTHPARRDRGALRDGADHCGDLRHHRDGDLPERRAHLQPGAAEAHRALHRHGRHADGVLARRRRHLPDPRHLRRDRPGVLPDRAGLRRAGRVAGPRRAAPLRRLRRLRRHRHDHPAGLRRGLHRRRGGRGESRKGLPRGPALRGGRAGLRRRDDLPARGRDLAAELL